MPKKILAFDLYGTLLSTTSISSSLSAILTLTSEKSSRLASRWRALQLEYSWRLTCMGQYVSFRELTQASLLHVLLEAGIQSPEEQTVESLMRAYDGLPAFDDVARGVQILAAEKDRRADVKAVVFSNGSEDAVRKAVVESGIGGGGPAVEGAVFDGVVSVEAIRAFKPSPEAYKHLLSAVGGWEDAEVWLVSSNPFDIVGALGYGIENLKAVWVDRAAAGWADRLGSVVGINEPTMVVQGVDEAVRRILGGDGGY